MNVEMRIHRDPDRRHITRTMPRQTYAKGLTQHRQLQGRGDAANLRNMAANKINLPVDDEVMPLRRIIKQLPHRQRHAGLLANLRQPRALLRR